ncbi:MAG: sodium:alanine symporter family protein [Oscillospiraceae bacterium]|nr:sodium:alanine symporter family protein [Oscillospiraceae bacterium]
MYYPVLIIILAAAGLYFSVRSGFVQLRLFTEACRLITEKPAKGEQKISSFQALIVSTASRVGTGNIVGVSTAICIGGSAYYIEEALKKPVISVLCIFLIATYAVGFNLLCIRISRQRISA